VGLVICPGGGYRDVWLDREGHDLAIWLKDYGITSLVLKYRTNAPDKEGQMVYAWEEYLPAVEADARQAIRILRDSAADLGLQPNRIGICGFSAGGNLALLATLHAEPKQLQPQTSGLPDFTGLFYPWFRDEYGDDLARRSAAESPVRPVGPVFMMNAQDDRVTPPEKCVAFYQQLLAAGVQAELHIYTRGSHGFDLGVGRGESTAMWPASFIAFLRDVKIMP
jgi:acetyl esterase/lipase